MRRTDEQYSANGGAMAIGLRPDTVLRWIARAWGLASSLLLMAFVFGGRENLQFTAASAMLFLLFPVGIVAGIVVAWWRELAGGLITVGSLGLFYLVVFARNGWVPGTPYFLLFAGPGFLHVMSALIAARRDAVNQLGRRSDPSN